MNKEKNDYRLDLTLCFGRSLFVDDSLKEIENLLQEHAPNWSEELYVWQEGTGRRSLGQNFSETVRAIASEKGEFFGQLAATHGAGPYARWTGSVELRGRDESLIVVIGMDEYEFAPSAGRYLWGNTIAIQVLTRKVGNVSAKQFVRSFAEDACIKTSPFYAHGHTPMEREAKNISRDDGGMMAIGLDVSRYLPGLYWLNFFGAPYCELIGNERALTAPAHEVKAVHNGILVVVDEDPEMWCESNNKNAAVLTHLGDNLFFQRDQPRRQTVAPTYGLKELPRIARFS